MNLHLVIFSVEASLQTATSYHGKPLHMIFLLFKPLCGSHLPKTATTAKTRPSCLLKITSRQLPVNHRLTNKVYRAPGHSLSDKGPQTWSGLLAVCRHLTIVPRACVGYEMVDSQRARCAELAIIISYPTSASGIIVLLKTPQNRGKLDWNGNKNAPKNSRVRFPYL